MDVGTTIIVVISGLAGLFLMYTAWRLRREALASRSWPTTTGRITASTVVEVKEYRHRRRSRIRHQVEVSYQYTVQGRSYQADRIAWSPPRFVTPAEAQQFAAKYSVGSQVTVSYNPQQPGSAVLQPYSDPKVSLLNWQGMGCLLGAVVVFGIFSAPGLAITLAANRQTADEKPLVQRPAGDLLVGIQPFPSDWVIYECDICEMYNNDEQAVRRFDFADTSGGVVQNVFRFESPVVAQTRLATAEQNMAKEMPIAPTFSYHSPVAEAQIGSCGIDYAQLVCSQIHRYGQYLVILEYRPAGTGEAGLEPAEIETILRAIDALARERLGAGRITSGS